jgi:hypothetical protein
VFAARKQLPYLFKRKVYYIGKVMALQVWNEESYIDSLSVFGAIWGITKCGGESRFSKDRLGKDK